jgi:hypothetical protein
MKAAGLVVEGESSVAESFGFRRGKQSVRVSSLTDFDNAKLPVVRERGLSCRRLNLDGGRRNRAAAPRTTPG